MATPPQKSCLSLEKMSICLLAGGSRVWESDVGAGRWGWGSEKPGPAVGVSAELSNPNLGSGCKSWDPRRRESEKLALRQLPELNVLRTQPGVPPFRGEKLVPTRHMWAACPFS